MQSIAFIMLHMWTCNLAKIDMVGRHHPQIDMGDVFSRCCMIHYQNLSRDAATVSLLQRLSPQRCLYMYNVFMPPALTKTTAVCPGMRSCWNLRAATKSWRKTSLPFSLNMQSSRHFAETANLRGEIKCLVHSIIENHGGKSEVLYKKVMEKELVHL